MGADGLRYCCAVVHLSRAEKGGPAWYYECPNMGSRDTLAMGFKRRIRRSGTDPDGICPKPHRGSCCSGRWCTRIVRSLPSLPRGVVVFASHTPWSTYVPLPPGLSETISTARAHRQQLGSSSSDRHRTTGPCPQLYGQRKPPSLEATPSHGSMAPEALAHVEKTSHRILSRK